MLPDACFKGKRQQSNEPEKCQAAHATGLPPAEQCIHRLNRPAITDKRRRMGASSAKVL